MRSAASPMFIALLAVAGCVANDEPTVTPPGGGLPPATDPWAPIKDLLADVPCEVDVVGDETSENLVTLANLSFDGTAHGEVDVRGDLALVARWGTGGFEVVNISRPLEPVHVGEFTDMEGGLDVKWSPDGATALVGHEGGIVLVDVRDATTPRRVGEWTFPAAPPGGLPLQNAHMLYAARIADVDWVFLAPNTGSGVWILALEGPPEARSLRFVTQTLPVEGGAIGPHDMVVQFDADLKKWLLYSADGFHGWLVFDVDDPAHPVLYGGLPKPETGYTHTIQAAKVGSRRLVATIQEVGENFLEVYDATNLRAPILLGAWQAHATRGVESQHNFNIVGGKLYLAHYANGIYVFDLAALGSTPFLETLSLSPMAHFSGGATASLGVGSYWDAVLQQGILYGGDIGGGLTVIGFGCNVPGDAWLTSIG